MAINKNKCDFNDCKKKLSITQLIACKCKCSNQYCILHRLPEQHNCNYNFKKIDIDEFIKQNKCSADKLIRI